MDTLVLCIDRDDDIGRKTGIKGPIIGVENNLEAAKKLALSDPEDSDVNAIFGAVKIATELKTEVATITGDVNAGVVSDKKLCEQLDSLIKDLKIKSVVIVTDGAADEQILPLIQSRVKIDSIRTIIIRQSKELEKAYFTITNFIRETSKEPALARLMFGIPGIALIILALGAAFNALLQASAIILGITGIYLGIKASGKEDALFARFHAFVGSQSVERLGTLTYIIAFITFIIGLGYGYDRAVNTKVTVFSDTLASFILGSAEIVLLAVGIAVLGKSIEDYVGKRYLNIRRYLIILAFVFLVEQTAVAGSNLWFGGITLVSFVKTVVVGVIFFGFVIKITEYIFIGEIKAREDLYKKLHGAEVYDKDGKKIGKVTDVSIIGYELSEIRVGRRRIPKADIASLEGKIVLNK